MTLSLSHRARSVAALVVSFASLLPSAASAAEPETPAPQPAQPAPVAQVPQAKSEPACTAEARKRTYFGARDSIVTIEPIGLSTDAFFPLSGWVHPSKKHVVTLSDAIGVGRGVRVVFSNGTVLHARAVALDKKNQLTILALESEAPVAGLEVSDAPLEPGQEVMSLMPYEGASIKNPDETVTDTRIQVGHVANAGDRTQLRFDSAGAFSRGTPVFDCEGKLVALRDIDELISGTKIRALVPSETPINDKKWDFLHLHLGALIQADSTRPWVGLGIGWSAVYADRLQLRTSFSGLAGIPKDAERVPEQRLSFGRMQLEQTVGYRILLSESTPLYLVPQIGAVGRANVEIASKTQYQASDRACLTVGSGPCNLDAQTSRSSRWSFDAAPVVGLSFLGVIGGLSYQWQMDVADPRKSTHQIFFGLEF